MILPRYVLADTSVWIDHLNCADERFTEELERGALCIHPFVIGEIALGHLRNRAVILASLEALPAPPVATHEEVLDLIDANELMGRGIGYVDAHLLASAALGDVRLWTHDQCLRDVAEGLGLT